MIKMTNILKVQSSLKKYKTIKTDKTTSRIIDGSYVSVYKGRSMNFDELRDYVPGDEIRDIDWKATARSQKVLVRQYIAEKKHNILLILDTNRRMLGETSDGVEKKEVGLISAGGLAYLVNKNGDYVGSIYQKGDLIQHFPLKTGLINIENILSNYSASVNLDNKSKLSKSIEHVIRTMQKKMIVVIVTDTKGIYETDEALFRRLVFMHDVLVINISDADYTGKKVYSIEDGAYLPAFITENKKFARKEAANRAIMQDACDRKLSKYGIASITVDNVDEIDVQLSKLFEKRKMVKR